MFLTGPFIPGSGGRCQFCPGVSGQDMRTAQTKAIIQHGADPAAATQVGRAIQCKGCGEIGRAAWERSPADSFDARPVVTRLSGNFYLHNAHIACGRCQQIYRSG